MAVHLLPAGRAAHYTLRPESIESTQRFQTPTKDYQNATQVVGVAVLTSCV